MSSFFLDERSLHTAGKLVNMKKDNRKLVLANMEFDKPATVAEIADRTGISKTTLSKMVADFCKIGIIKFVGKGSSTSEGGKKPDLFTLNAEYKYVLAIQLSCPKFIQCAIMNLANEVIIKEVVSTPIDITYDDAIKLIGEIVKRIMKKSKLSNDNICGIAVACDGIVDSKNKIALRPAHHRWRRNLPVGNDIEKITGLTAEITVDNDCRFGGYAELLFPENRRYGNMLVIMTGNLVGGCVLNSNMLVQGQSGLVGEVGHMIMDMNSDVKCSCGGYGCFEPLASTLRLIDRAYKLPGSRDSELSGKIADSTLTEIDIFNGANNGDAFSRELLDEVINYYAVLIRNITNLLDVEKIILQGCYALAGDYFYDTLRERLSLFPLHSMTVGMVIEASSYTDKTSYIMGASFYAITNYFNNGMEDSIL